MEMVEKVLAWWLKTFKHRVAVKSFITTKLLLLDPWARHKTTTVTRCFVLMWMLQLLVLFLGWYVWNVVIVFPRCSDNIQPSVKSPVVSCTVADRPQQNINFYQHLYWLLQGLGSIVFSHFDDEQYQPIKTLIHNDLIMCLFLTQTRCFAIFEHLMNKYEHLAT